VIARRIPPRSPIRNQPLRFAELVGTVRWNIVVPRLVNAAALLGRSLWDLTKKAQGQLEATVSRFPFRRQVVQPRQSGSE